MELKGLFFACLAIASASAQTYKVCILSSEQCQSVEIGNSQVTCTKVDTRVDCALKLASGEVDVGYFSEEELLMLGQMQPELRAIASVRNINKPDPVAFEAVAVVPSTHTGGLEGLRGGAYCHPGFDETDQRWSPRVLKTLEVAAAQTDRCGESAPPGKSADQIELETLNSFFSSGCRPGPWSANETQDADLKTQYPSLCSLCESGCNGYAPRVQVAGDAAYNRHYQTLDCLRDVNTSAVAYVAWSHVTAYFSARAPLIASNYAILCPDGTLRELTTVLNATAAPCAFVRQPWGSVVASPARADAVLTSLRTWYPTGLSPANSAGWQSTLFSVLAPGGASLLSYENASLSVVNVTSTYRPIPTIDSTPACLPPARWCTLSPSEQTKCSWVRSAAYTLGLQPAIACQQRASVLDCLKEIREGRADFISSPSNYGYLARQHYKLSPVKLVQNRRQSTSRIAAFVKENSTNNITRFENLKGAKACFPEFGGLAYMAFVRAGQERGVLSTSECDYARTVGEFFGSACAPGAEDASHALSESTYDASNLCSVCKPAAPVNETSSICTWDYSNKYFGNNGSLACLLDNETDVAFINTMNLDSYLNQLRIPDTYFRALCRNNSLAVTAGGNIDDNCALANVVDAEIVTRRNDPIYESLNVLLDTLDKLFGYNAPSGTTQLINLYLFSPFNGASNLLFKDSTIGLTEPLESSTHEPAKNYIELFKHLDGCTSGASVFSSMFSLVVLSVVGRFLIQ